MLNKRVRYSSSLVCAALLALAWHGPGRAQSCPSYPYTLTNGSTADANQVMANFNSVYSCDASFGAGEKLSIAGLSFGSGVGFNRRVEDGLIFSPSHYAFQLWHYGGSTPQTDGLSLQLYSPSGAFLGLPLYVSAQGTVGVNKSTPAEALDVGGFIATDNGLKIGTASGQHVQFVSGGDGNFVFYNTDASNNLYPTFYQYSHTNSSTFVFLTPVSIPSDGRLKKNIQPIEGALATLQKLRPVSYNWRSKGERTVGQQFSLEEGKTQLGFVAQEVEKIVPAAVVAPRDGADIYTMRPDVLIPLLVRAIQEQQAEIDQLKAQRAPGG